MTRSRMVLLREVNSWKGGNGAVCAPVGLDNGTVEAACNQLPLAFPAILPSQAFVLPTLSLLSHIC